MIHLKKALVSKEAFSGENSQMESSKNFSWGDQIFCVHIHVFGGMLTVS